MATTVANYLSLIAPEHRNQPDYIQTVTLEVQPFVDMINKLETMNRLFDVDVAVGQQLDYTGQWIGRTRFIATPLNIYFSLDTLGLGCDQGVWFGPYEAATGQTRLDDPPYRILLKATIAANMWDGTIPGAYTAWNDLLNPFGFGILVQDYDNMTMGYVLIGNQPDVITSALFTTGELDLKPDGVELFHMLPTVFPAGVVGTIRGTPVFGLDVDNANVGGCDHGAWVKIISTE